MVTVVLEVDAIAPDRSAIREAAAILRRGGLVAFPTETVYGLGANALDAEAVGSIFAAKGRPATNPLIVHVPGESEARRLTRAWPREAEDLAARFWPGPLTLVLPKADVVPAVVTAGGDTVAVRAPSHPVAHTLLVEAGLPVAAPSANRSSHVSPTQASHVLRGLDARIDLLLDGGACPGGIESTVLDLAAPTPRLLRPGLITRAAIEAVIGPIEGGPAGASGGPLRSPGMMARHYAPEAGVELVTEGSSGRVEALSRAGLRVGWLRMDAGIRPIRHAGVEELTLPAEPEGYAAGLYAALYRLDEARVDRIVVEAPPDAPEWLAVRDRLRRAATPA